MGLDGGRAESGLSHSATDRYVTSRVLRTTSRHCTHVRFFSEVAQEVLSAREKHYQLLYQLVDEDDHGLSLHDLQHGVPNRDLTVPHFSHLQ